MECKYCGKPFRVAVVCEAHEKICVKRPPMTSDAAKKESANILEDAKKEAKKILDTAKKEAEKIVKDAKKK